MEALLLNYPIYSPMEALRLNYPIYTLPETPPGTPSQGYPNLAEPGPELTD